MRGPYLQMAGEGVSPQDVFWPGLSCTPALQPSVVKWQHTHQGTGFGPRALANQDAVKMRHLMVSSIEVCFHFMRKGQCHRVGLPCK